LIAQHPALRRGVLYIEDFDDPPGSAPASIENTPGILAPSFSAEDLEAARQQAYADGSREGQSLATRERAHATRLLLESLTKSISETQAAMTAQAELIAESLAKALLACLCGSLPDLCRTHAEPETRAIIKRVMPGLAREARLDIRVHPDLVACVQDQLALLPQELPEKLTVIADPSMEPTDIRANWKFGHLIRSSRQIWDDVRAQLAAFDLVIPPTPETPNAG